MVILHEGIDSNGRKHIGYAVKYHGTYRILHDDIFYTVDPDSIKPIEQCAVEHLISRYTDVLGKSVIRNFNSQGAYYFEDLRSWTDDELKSVRGVGDKKISIIKKMIAEL